MPYYFGRHSKCREQASLGWTVRGFHSDYQTEETADSYNDEDPAKSMKNWHVEYDLEHRTCH